MGKSKQVFADEREKEIFEKERETENALSERESSRADGLKKRVIEAKKQLPTFFGNTFLHVFPEYQTYKGKSRFTNVVQLRVADEEITEKIEKLIEILKQK
ncbi:hypothetical protein UFOVP105_44 [uncultured Caudovirales phage]|uniref:Uncharacterized protein n=1 Tax=uncultured Caudovirales phage TaxID=2100421 RepID=A0A6J5L558_9CAUD|nr:hypothetical protein UFOVP105_44 [uncultured Caudovirales phage]